MKNCCSAIFKQAVVHQLTVPTEGRKTHTRNPLESTKEAVLLRPGHPYPFSSEHPSSCLESSLVRLHKKNCFSKGPMSRHKTWTLGHMPLADTASSRSCHRKNILIMWQRELRDMITRVRTPFSTSLQRFQLQATLSLFHDIKGWE